jgi:hypothetical protein
VHGYQRKEHRKKLTLAFGGGDEIDRKRTSSLRFIRSRCTARKREVVDECLGCKEEIYQGDEVLKHPDGTFHDDVDCFVKYIRKDGIKEIA